MDTNARRASLTERLFAISWASTFAGVVDVFRIPAHGPNPRMVRLLTLRLLNLIGIVTLGVCFADVVLSLAAPDHHVEALQEITRPHVEVAGLAYLLGVAWLMLLKAQNFKMPEHDTFNVPASYDVLFLLLPLLFLEGRLFGGRSFELICALTHTITLMYIGAQLMFVDRHTSPTGKWFDGFWGGRGHRSLIGGALVRVLFRLHATLSLLRTLPEHAQILATAFAAYVAREDIRHLPKAIHRQLILALKGGTHVDGWIQVRLPMGPHDPQGARRLIGVVMMNVARCTGMQIAFAQANGPDVVLTAGARAGLLMALEHEWKGRAK